jgi:hypothetical protein
VGVCLAIFASESLPSYGDQPALHVEQ